MMVLGLLQVHTKQCRFLLPLFAIRQSQVVWDEECREAKRFRVDSLHGRCHTWTEWEEKMLVDGNFMDEFRLDKSALQELLGSIGFPEWAVVGRRRCPRTDVITFKGFKVYKVEMLLLVLCESHRPVANSQAGAFFCMSSFFLNRSETHECAMRRLDKKCGPGARDLKRWRDYIPLWVISFVKIRSGVVVVG
jgi:hypothetical protein